MSLLDWGWNSHFAAFVSEYPDFRPGRVLTVHSEQYRVADGEAEHLAELSGSLLFRAESPLDLPAAGDWVLMQPGVIHWILPRKTALIRHAAGKRAEPQLLAANLDVLFIVSGLDGDWNPRRLERYLVLAAQSGAKPVIVLNKSDLCLDEAAVAAQIEAIAPTHRVLWTCATSGSGVDAIRDVLASGVTGALVGSSGAGKSTILNQLLGHQRQATCEVREDDSRGRHTTTHRQLFALTSGGWLIDMPGLREVQLWAGDGALSAAFDDISALSPQCRFRDCRHVSEPGCAVIAARDEGLLDPARFAAFHKLRSETQRLAAEMDPVLRRQRRQADKSGQKLYRKWRRLEGQ